MYRITMNLRAMFTFMLMFESRRLSSSMEESPVARRSTAFEVVI
jgi:hypothetical protein